MNGNMVPVLIVAMVMFMIIMKARYRYLSGHREGDGEGGVSSGNPRETAQLKDEVRQLKDRIHVLERIAVDKENSLANEIEQLRDR